MNISLFASYFTNPCVKLQAAYSGPKDVLELLKANTTTEELALLVCSSRKPRPTNPNGHCGWEALLQCLPLERTSSPYKLRLDFYKYIVEQAALDFPEKPASVWTECCNRIFPGGQPLEGPAKLSFEKFTGSAHWLSSAQLPYLAQMLQRVICLCGSSSSSIWASYLPRRLTSLPVKPPIGLWYTTDHYESVRLKDGVRLPPVTTDGWPPVSMYRTFVGMPSHQVLHQQHKFYVWTLEPRSECGCYPIAPNGNQYQHTGSSKSPQRKVT
jgi:hypothetical protein